MTEAILPIKKFDVADSVVKTYTTGSTVKLGNLFKEIANITAPVEDGNVVVSFEGVGVTGTYSANTSDWTLGTLVLEGEGVATITITDGTTFYDLNKKINGNDSQYIILDKNYTYNSSFDADFINGIEITRNVTIDGMAMLLCSGDSYEADRIRDALLEQAKRIVREGIPEDAFLRMKRSAFGRRIRDLDSFDSTCFRLCAYDLSDFDYFRFPDVSKIADLYFFTFH